MLRIWNRYKVGWQRTTVMLVLLLMGTMGTTQSVQSQTAVSKYLPVGDSLIPFTMYVAPAVPSTLTATTFMSYNFTVSTAQISWAVSSDADQYKLELLDAGGNQWSVIYDGPNTTYTVDNLPLGIRYFRVIACGGGLCSEASPSTSALIQLNLDIDMDGIEDAFDLCLGTAEGATVSAAGCIPTTNDTDNDGVTDDLDWCPGTTPGDPTVNASGCGQDQIDSDGDGTADYLDAYPYQSATQCTP